MSDSTTAEVVQLKRTISLLGGVSFIVGTIIGAGIFISPKTVVLQAGSYGLALIIWAAAGVMSTCFAFTYAELGTRLPLTGASYNYLVEGLHPVVGYLSTVYGLLVNFPGSLTIVSMTCANYILILFYSDSCGQAPEQLIKLLALVLLGVSMYVNNVSAESSTKVQMFSTVSKVLALVIIIIGGIVTYAGGTTTHLVNTFTGSTNNAGDVVLGLYACLWAYDGWYALNSLIEELDNPLRNLPLAIIISLPLVTAIYILTNISYFIVMSPSEFKDSPAVSATWAEYVMPGFYWIIPIAVAISTYGGMNSIMFRSGRNYFAVSREGQMPQIFTMLNVHSFIPQIGIILTFTIAVIFITLSDIGTVLNMLVFSDAIFSSLVYIVSIRWRWSEKNQLNAWKAPLLMPYWSLLFSIFLVVVPLVFSPSMEFLYGAIAVLSGLIFYVPFVHYKLELPGMRALNTGLQLLCQVCPPEYDQKIIITKEIPASNSVSESCDIKSQHSEKTTL